MNWSLLLQHDSMTKERDLTHLLHWWITSLEMQSWDIRKAHRFATMIDKDSVIMNVLSRSAVIILIECDSSVNICWILNSKVSKIIPVKSTMNSVSVMALAGFCLFVSVTTFLLSIRYFQQLIILMVMKGPMMFFLVENLTIIWYSAQKILCCVGSSKGPIFFLFSWKRCLFV